MNEDDILNLFAAEDTIADHEYYLNFRNNLGPERSLMLSVFIEGILDFLSKRGKNYDSAREWLFNTEDKYLFSYLNITREFDIDSIIFQAKVVKLRKNRHLANKRIKQLNSVFTWKPQSQEK